MQHVIQSFYFNYYIYTVGQKNRPPKWFHYNFWSFQDNATRAFFQTNSKLSVKTSFTNTLEYERLQTNVGDFSNYNYFIIFTFILMNKISITTEMYLETWVSVVKLDFQCDHHLFPPLPLISAAIGWLNYWWIFLSVDPIHLILLLKALRCLNITFRSCCASFALCPKLHNQVATYLIMQLEDHKN